MVLGNVDVQMSTGEFNAGGNPVMDEHHIQGQGEYSLRSWRYCKRKRNEVLAAEPTSERRSCEENRERNFSELRRSLLAAPPPRTRHTASYAA